VYLVDAGLVLIVAPWTDLWQHNYFAALWPRLGDWMASAYARGAVTGIGIVTAAAGVREFARAIAARTTGRAGAGPRPGQA
jgi:hypothetical protein